MTPPKIEGCQEPKCKRSDPMLTTRELPDYSWPVRLPIEQLRRLIEHEIDDALQELARAGLPRP
jgi:hypothetical protein